MGTVSHDVRRESIEEVEREAAAARSGEIQKPRRPSGVVRTSDAPERTHDPDSGPRALDLRVQNMLEAELYFRRGERALHRSEYQRAFEAFDRAVKLCPDEGEFLIFRGYARHGMAGNAPLEVEEAIVEIQRGCELAPRLDIGHVLYARVLREHGKGTQAKIAYEKALEANPDCREALEGLRELLR